MSKPLPTGPSEGLRQDALRARKFRTSRTIAALILREMSTTFGRSPGGYLWAILDPVAGLLLLSFVFSLAFAGPPLGTSFGLFYATGYLPFVMFNEIANKMATSINFSKPLLAYPAVTLLDALIARFSLAILTNIMVGYIIYFIKRRNDSSLGYRSWYAELLFDDDDITMGAYLANSDAALIYYLGSVFPL